eukprot:9810008-Alexandrium_andersonii.AAC.1
MDALADQPRAPGGTRHEVFSRGSALRQSVCSEGPQLQEKQVPTRAEKERPYRSAAAGRVQRGPNQDPQHRQASRAAALDQWFEAQAWPRAHTKRPRVTP